MNKQALSMVFLWIGLVSLAHASSGFLLHEQGWHWYQRLKQPLVVHDSISETINPKTPQQQLQVLRDTVDAVRARAVLYPTTENVARYIMLQNTIAENAEVFSRTWQTVLWRYPFLNTQLESPMNQTSQALDREKKEKAQELLLHEAGKNVGLVFFLTPTCPYCQQFGPTVKAVSERYHLPIVAVSLTGEGLPDFPDPLTDHGQAKILQVTHLPALFVVSPRAHDIQLVTMGVLSETALVERLVAVIQTMGKSKMYGRT
jgi:conjugal transfer pilus assembly protein TraF